MEYIWINKASCFTKICNGKSIELENNKPLELEFFIYAMNFKHAAHFITEKTLANGRIDQLDSYFFPLAFLYRHSLELILKAISFLYIKDIEDRKKFINDTNHNLNVLLSSVIGYSSKAIKNHDSIKWLITYFKNLDTVDRESDSFRYPFRIIRENNNSYYTLPIFDKQTHIDLVSFANKQEVAFDILKNIFNNILPENEFEKHSTDFIDDGGQYYGQSVVGYKNFGSNYHLHVNSYNKCGQLLFHIIDADINNKYLFIPMCYLFRNAVELSIKRIIFEQSSIEHNLALKKIATKKHSLLALWNCIEGKVIEHGGNSGDDNIEHAKNYINQLHNFDLKADRFRYPVNRYLEYHYANKLVLDIENIYIFFVGIINFLDGVDSMMSEHNEIISEMENEWRSEMEADYGDYYE